MDLAERSIKMEKYLKVPLTKIKNTEVIINFQMELCSMVWLLIIKEMD